MLGLSIAFDAACFEFAEFTADADRAQQTPETSVAVTASVATMRVVIADLTGGTAVLAGDGILGVLRLRALTPLDAAVVPLLVAEVAAMDTTITEVETSRANGEIQIGAVSGDVDDDSLTNFRDVVFIYRRLFGLSTLRPGWTLPPGETEASVNARIDALRTPDFAGFAPLDVDHDGQANFRDVVFIYRRLFGLSTLRPGWTLPPGETEASVNLRIDWLRR